ncbi:formate dehydrogenase FDH3 subunit beta [Vibrio harveyi]|nr:formate dehydrogenase FDH3 subunit beta [Vibrio harveyi]
MARMKFLCDTKRCIECNGCVTACKNENDDALEWGIQRRRVVTLNDGEPGENSISVACMHCTDAPCMAVCPADCFEHTEDGIVLHNKDLCIGCGYCLFACPFGAPQFPKQASFGERGKMDKCTFCVQVPNTEPGSLEEREKYGANRIAEGKLPMCASLCSTKALLAGDAEKVSDIFRQRVVERGAKNAGWTDGNDLSYDATKS